MILKNGFLINPDKYLTPTYKISPFSNYYMFKNRNINEFENKWKEYAINRWGGNNYQLTENGRSALYKVLNKYKLKPSNQVTILTVTGNDYISSCVTGVVESFCTWNRELNSNTNIILVIHEFGKTFRDLEQLKSLGIPIIEDCAYAFCNSNSKIGTIGEFCIYSFPKFFPIQFGGLITSKNKIDFDSELNNDFLIILNRALDLHIVDLEKIIDKRFYNFNYLKKKIEKYGLKTRLNFENGEVPGVFMFNTIFDIDLNNFKQFLNLNGIESSVFYGEKSYFIPCHQELNIDDLDYFLTVISLYFSYD